MSIINSLATISVDTHWAFLSLATAPILRRSTQLGSARLVKRLTSLQSRLTDPKLSEAQKKPSRNNVRHLPVRGTRFNSYYYFQKASNLWHWLLASLPIDVVVLSFLSINAPSANSGRGLEATLATLLALSLLFTAHSAIVTILSRARSAQARIEGVAHRYSWLAIGILVSLLLGDLVLRFWQGPSLIILAIVLVVAAVSTRAFVKEWRKKRIHDRLLESDRLLWVEQANWHIFLLAAIPMGLARAVSVCGALFAASHSDPLLTYLPCGVGALLLLLAALPQRDQFMLQCSGCGRWTSRALKDLGGCPHCAPHDFQIKVIEQSKSK